jgi:diguanylate cyclase (GGDEF)-like protein/PAS domain S-box-containing protein
MIKPIPAAKQKRTYIVAIILVIIGLLLPALVFFEQKDNLETRINHTNSSMNRFIEHHIRRLSSGYFACMQVLTESQDFVSAVSSNDLAKLQSILSRRIALLKNDMPNIIAINVYDDNSERVLYLEDNQQTFNILTDKEAVKSSIGDLRPLSGFDISDGRIYYRLIRPITDPHGKMLGGLELIIGSNYFIEILQTMQPDIYPFIKSITPNGSPLYVTSTANKEAVSLYGTTDKSIIHHTEKSYAVLRGMSFTNYKGEPIVTLKAFYNITEARRVIWKKTFLYTVLIISFFSGIYLMMLRRSKLVDEYCSKRENKVAELVDIINESSNVIIRWESSFSRNINLCSKNIEKLTGYTQEQFYSGQIRYTSLIDTSDLGCVAAEIEAAVAAQKASVTLSPYRIITKSGSATWVYETIRFFREKTGELRYMLGYLHDITAIYADVSSLKTSLEQLELSARSSSWAGLWHRDLITGKLTFTRGWKNNLGYIESEIENTSQAWFDLIHQEDRQLLVRGEERLIAGELESFVCEFRHICADGSFRWIEITGRAIFNRDGRPVGIAGFSYDITDRKNTEISLTKEVETLRVLMENMPVPSFYEDQQLRFVGSNKRFLEFVGASSEDIVEDLTAKGLYGGSQAEIHTAYSKLALEDSGRMYEYEAEITTDSGKRKVLVYKRAYKSSDGRPLGIIGSMIDITEMKSLQRMLMNNADEVHRAKKDLDDAQSLAKIGSWRYEANTGRIVWSDEFYKILGLDSASVLPSLELFLEFVYIKDRENVRNTIETSLHTGQPFSVEHSLNIPDVGQKHVHTRGSITLSEDGKPAAMIGTIQDVTDINNAYIALDRTNAMLSEYSEIVDKNVIISRTDYNGKITYVSEAFCRAAEKTSEELIGRKHNIIAHPDMDKSVYKDLWDTIKAGRVWKGEIRNRSGRGNDYWVNATISPTYSSEGIINGFTAICNDITVKKQMEQLSVTDPLTKLFNRFRLDSVFKSELVRCERYKCELSVIIIDVDGFKAINDKYGHQIGDIVLKSVADVLRDNIRKADTLGRWGGEEFIIICPETDVTGATHLAEKVRKAVEAHKFAMVSKVTCSLGVAGYEPGFDESIMIKYADQALYKAKQHGRNRVVAHLKEISIDEV